MARKKKQLKEKPKKFKVKKGDEVMVIAGKDRGRRGKVLKVLPKEEKVIVENINMVKKHQRANPQKNQPASIVEKAMPIHISNVMVIDKTTGQPTRVGRKLVGGKLLRYAKRSGELIDTE